MLSKDKEKIRAKNRKIPEFARYLCADLSVEDQRTIEEWESKSGEQSIDWLELVVCEMAYKTAPWGRLRNRYHGTNSIYGAGIHSGHFIFKPGHFIFKRRVCHYADYRAVSSKDGRIYVELPDGRKLTGRFSPSGKYAKLGYQIYEDGSPECDREVVLKHVALRGEKRVLFATEVKHNDVERFMRFVSDFHTVERVGQNDKLEFVVLCNGFVEYHIRRYHCDRNSKLYMTVNLFSSRTTHLKRLEIILSPRKPEQFVASLDSLMAIGNVEMRSALLFALGREFWENMLDDGSIKFNEKGRSLIKLHDLQTAVLAVQCPSTGKRTVLFVPSWLRDAEEAAAWTFGMDADEWKALSVET